MQVTTHLVWHLPICCRTFLSSSFPWAGQLLQEEGEFLCDRFCPATASQTRIIVDHQTSPNCMLNYKEFWDFLVTWTSECASYWVGFLKEKLGGLKQVWSETGTQNVIRNGFTSWKNGNNVLRFFFFLSICFFLPAVNEQERKLLVKKRGCSSCFSGQKQREGTNGNAVRKSVIKRKGTNFRLKFKISKTVI